MVTLDEYVYLRLWMVVVGGKQNTAGVCVIDIERGDWPTPFPDISRCMQTRRPSWVGAPKVVATCKQSGRSCFSCGKT